MVAYVGRPLVLEPGHRAWSLRRAVEYLQEHADGPHAWFVKVSGPIRGFPNTLVPSTPDALTNDNYKSRDANRTARKANVARLDRTGRAVGDRQDETMHPPRLEVADRDRPRQPAGERLFEPGRSVERLDPNRPGDRIALRVDGTRLREEPAARSAPDRRRGCGVSCVRVRRARVRPSLD